MADPHLILTLLLAVTVAGRICYPIFLRHLFFRSSYNNKREGSPAGGFLHSTRPLKSRSNPESPNPSKAH